MRKLLISLSRFRKDEEGAALVEYAVLLGIILAVTVGTFTAIGGSTSTIFTALSTLMAAAAA
jgi:pilus assembly protein Flp/PilA